MVTFTALFDACVLYPAPLRDLLMRVALTGLFRARWTADIHEEWMRNLLAKRPDLTRGQLEQTRRLMDSHVHDALVTGYEPLIPSLTLPDMDDRHVLAAAIRSGASVIVTYNLKDFPASILSPMGIEAQHPDEFLLHLVDLSPGAVCAAVKAQRAALKHPPYTAGKLLDTLQQQQLPETVSALRQFADLL